MKTKRWIGVLGVVAWSLTGGAAGGADEKPPRPEVKAEAKSPAKADRRAHGKGGSADQHQRGLEVRSDEARRESMPGAAQKIIAYREAHGPFKRAQDLGKVRGVGKEVVETQRRADQRQMNWWVKNPLPRSEGAHVG